MRKIIFIITAFFALAQSANAQMDFRSKYGIQSLPVLKVGDQVPDFTMAKLVNSAKKNLKISEFKDQLVIFDFWATWCGGCVAGLPKMEMLQQKFGDKVKMLPVTYEPEAMITTFWKENAKTKNLTIPTVVEDKVILSYFPHRVVPNEIWIYKGKVIAITPTDFVNEDNIAKVLSGAVINWPVKNDFNFFDGNKQYVFKLDSNQIDPKSTFIKYAAISDFRPGVTAAFLNSGIYTNGIVRDPVKKTIRVFDVNIPIYNSYCSNWIFVNMGRTEPLVRPGAGTPNEVVWEVANKYKYIQDPKSTFDEWLIKNGICFESLNPDTGQTDAQIYKTVNEDLDRLLGLHVRWEKRKEKVLVLVRSTQTDKLKSKQSIAYNGKLGDDVAKRELQKGNLYQFRDWLLANLANRLNAQETNPYVFDETGYTGRVDMDLNISSWTDIAAVRKAIAPYGLALKEEERLVDKFVFSEVNGGLLVDVEMQKAAKAKREAQKGMKAPTPEEGKAFIASNKKKPGVMTLPSGVQYKIIEKGTGAKPGIGEKIISHQTAMLVNGQIFYNTKEDGRPGDPIGLDGEWERIKGLQEVLKLMPVGSKWEVYLPAELAYGGASANGRIPANSAVIYQVELLGIEK